VMDVQRSTRVTIRPSCDEFLPATTSLPGAALEGAWSSIDQVNL
jgi:hypothetical protein